MTTMIEIKNLSFSYNKREKIIQDVSLNVPTGTIYGFLGPNGSGKTTIIRLILNLLKSESGTITVDGTVIDRNSVAIFNKIGSMIEAPALYNHLSGLENLEIFALYYGIEKQRIQEILTLVGLDDAAQKIVKRYSLGMKQRLGIGICLLHNPELLILDEPLNGLDPHGIAEIRNLLIRLSREEGKTIFVSSHLLSEIETTCDHIGIIAKGKLLFEGKIEAFKSAKSGKTVYFIEASEIEKLAKFVAGFEGITLENRANYLVVEFEDQNDVPLLLKKIVENGYDVYNYQRHENNLEDLFLELTK